MKSRRVQEEIPSASITELRQPALTREAERLRKALGRRRRTVALRDRLPTPVDEQSFKTAGLD